MLVWKPNMSLTKDDVQTIKELLTEQKQEIVQETARKITTLESSLRKEVQETARKITTLESSLRQEANAQTQTVLGAIKALRDETIEAIGDLADQFAIQKEVDNLIKVTYQNTLH